ncbi:hypothetical protein P7M59_14080 [Vibrio parahaemolyticus]|nr:MULTISPECIES: hypothetical protein [Vibrio]MDF4990823.1 hypothetical protein [Vibrio parahaemolyticus]MDF5524736.1 hypothetical protein [Vibrio parahaemolyticus]MDF5535455.1 hypothetical protein [Vibrio parahaemolyticus]MDF5551739.1 hypothetical protein [Vibrio parahaemolyticus]MDF5562417.1 hypothetical protein [Vibrio parahaemolyticus]
MPMEILQQLPPLLLILIPILIINTLFGKPKEKDPKEDYRTVLKKIKNIVDEELRK